MKQILVTLLSLQMSFFATAQNKPQDRPFTQEKREIESPACSAIVKSCNAAGFKVGPAAIKDKKGLLTDCYNPLLNGKTIANVKVSDTDLKECIAMLKVLRPEVFSSASDAKKDVKKK